MCLWDRGRDAVSLLFIGFWNIKLHDFAHSNVNIQELPAPPHVVLCNHYVKDKKSLWNFNYLELNSEFLASHPRRRQSDFHLPAFEWPTCFKASRSVSRGLPWWLRGRQFACRYRGHGFDTWGQEDSPGEGNGNPLQYSCLEISTDRGAWWATVHGVRKSRTQLSHWHLTLFSVSYVVVLGWGQEICIYHKFPEDAGIWIAGLCSEEEGPEGCAKVNEENRFQGL